MMKKTILDFFCVLLVTLCLCMFVTFSFFAEDNVTDLSLDIHLGYESGIYYYGYSNPMTLVITNNEDSDFHGRLAVTLVPNVYAKETKRIETEILIGANSTKTVKKQLFGTFPTQYIAELYDEAGKLVWQETQFVESEGKGAVIGYISDTPEEFDWLCALSGEKCGDATIFTDRLCADTFPQNGEQISAFSMIIVGNADFSASSSFDKGQIQMLFRYVENGGTLILAGNADVISRLMDYYDSDNAAEVASSLLKEASIPENPDYSESFFSDIKEGCVGSESVQLKNVHQISLPDGRYSYSSSKDSDWGFYRYGDSGIYLSSLNISECSEECGNSVAWPFFYALNLCGALDDSLFYCGETQNSYRWNDDFLNVPEGGSGENKQYPVLSFFLIAAILLLAFFAIRPKGNIRLCSALILVVCAGYSVLFMLVRADTEWRTVNWSAVDVYELQNDTQTVRTRFVARKNVDAPLIVHSDKTELAVGDSVFALSHYRHHMMMDYFTYNPSYTVMYDNDGMEVECNCDKNGLYRTESFGSAEQYVPFFVTVENEGDGEFCLTVQNRNPLKISDAVLFYRGNTVLIGDLEANSSYTVSGIIPSERKFDFLKATERYYSGSGKSVPEIVSLVTEGKETAEYSDDYYPYNGWFEEISDESARNRAMILSVIARDVTDDGSAESVYVFGFDDAAAPLWTVRGAGYGKTLHETLVYQAVRIS